MSGVWSSPEPLASEGLSVFIASLTPIQWLLAAVILFAFGLAFVYEDLDRRRVARLEAERSRRLELRVQRSLDAVAPGARYGVAK